MSSIQGRGISSPVAVQGSSLPPEVSGQAPEGKAFGVAHLPGWTEKFVPPAFNLISLEEARAQRARNSSVEEESTYAIVSSQSNVTQNTDDGPQGRARGRTISAGTKAKNAFHSMVGSVITERRDSEPAIVPSQVQNVSQPAKQLKHRKSGFMRIFNGGKDKEPELPPPVPSIPSDSNLSRKASRVPVPSLDQSLSDSTSSRESDRARNNFASSTDSTGPRRAPPTLHINTASQGQLPMADRQQQSRTTGSFLASNPAKPWQNDMPQSAPPDVTAFPALKLRPVSGLFSSHFEDIVPDLQPTFSQSELMTPTTSGSNGPIFPMTPSHERFSNNDIDEQHTVKSGREQSASPSRRRVEELEAQVRSLKAELQELRSKQDGAHCDACGRGGSQFSPARDGSSSSGSSSSSRHSVVNRPRAKTGTASRFVNALA
ncbi:hypothetical protein EST38_g6338 [Candolleomyces aberdarensis]|uniref:Uncharacterized protein n=1 Tax=Candolleomyces aberdarensis TaxID=2316362 RepID=A0A4Q2DI13_9AGAR|nr:hypothetical protein EST38_g6338 [Candolleomyces aberdarensis]